MLAFAGMAGTMEAALLVVVDSIDGKQWYTSTKQRQKTSLQLCAAVRRLSRDKLAVLYNTPHLLPVVVVDGGSSGEMEFGLVALCSKKIMRLGPRLGH